MVDKSYFSSPAGEAYTLEVAKTISYIAMGFFFYDLILNASYDWAILSGRKQRKWPHLAYFTTRIALLVFFGLLLQALWGAQPFACQTTFYLIEFFMGVIVCSSSILLASRTICVYSGSARDIVATILSLMALGLLAAWMQGVLAVTAKWLPQYAHPWSEGACVWLAVSDTYFVKYICTIIFDAFVLAFTIVGITRMNGKSRLGYVLIRQGIVYFILTLVANSAITILTLLQLSPTMSLFLAIPQSVICVISACRLYARLASEVRSGNHTSQYSGCRETARGIRTEPSSRTAQSNHSQAPWKGRSEEQSSSSLAWGPLYTLRHDQPQHAVEETLGQTTSYFSNAAFDAKAPFSAKSVDVEKQEWQRHFGGLSSETQLSPTEKEPL